MYEPGEVCGGRHACGCVRLRTAACGCCSHRQGATRIGQGHECDSTLLAFITNRIFFATSTLSTASQTAGAQRACRNLSVDTLTRDEPVPKALTRGDHQDVQDAL